MRRRTRVIWAGPDAHDHVLFPRVVFWPFDVLAGQHRAVRTAWKDNEVQISGTIDSTEIGIEVTEVLAYPVATRLLV
jgi:hypothetical protein